MCTSTTWSVYLFFKNHPPVSQTRLQGSTCKTSEDLLTEMQYNIHNYVFSGV